MSEGDPGDPQGDAFREATAHLGLELERPSGLETAEEAVVVNVGLDWRRQD